MSNSIAYTKNYTSILDAVYQRASVSGCLTSGRRMVRAGRNAKEIMIPKIEVSGLGDYTRSGSGTSASPYVYTEVASPTKANLGTYYEMTTTPGLDINFMVVERSAVIKFDKHVASRVFSGVR